jgi:hypothetical protein
MSDDISDYESDEEEHEWKSFLNSKGSLKW